MVPEYAINGAISIKIDIFSFGVLLIEILSGQKNNSRFDLDAPLNLIGYVSFNDYCSLIKSNISYSNNSFLIILVNAGIILGMEALE